MKQVTKCEIKIDYTKDLSFLKGSDNSIFDKLSRQEDIGAFILCDQLDGSKIRTSVALRIPQKISGKDEYICGLTMHVEYGEEKDDRYFKISVGIIGYFLLKRMDVEIKDPEALNMFLKTQPAAILSPYVRAALSSFIISAGLPPIVFPLVNMKKIAEQNLADKDIIELPASNS